MESNPFQFLEGVAIASYAVGANAAYVYLRGEFWQMAAISGRKDRRNGRSRLPGRKTLRHGLFPAHLYSPWCGRLHLRRRDRHARIHRRQTRPAAHPSALPGGLRPVRQADRGQQRRNAHQPAADRGKWRRLVQDRMGTADSAGVKIFSLSGRVNKPGNYELPFGTTFRELIYEHGGGVPDDRPVKAIMPAGASSSMIVADDKVLDTPMDYASVRTLGADLGSASVIVIDDSVSIWTGSSTRPFISSSMNPAANARPAAKARTGCEHLIERIESGEATRSECRSACTLLPSKCRTSACARWASSPPWPW